LPPSALTGFDLKGETGQAHETEKKQFMVLLPHWVARHWRLSCIMDLRDALQKPVRLWMDLHFGASGYHWHGALDTRRSGFQSLAPFSPG
jgi:hypothetical protein